MLEAAALKHVDKKNILFRFWQNRFREMAPEIAKLMSASAPSFEERIIRSTYNGRQLVAVADRIENENKVVDYKTGSIPSRAQLGLDKDENCTMPQLPLEAMILQKTAKQSVKMAFFSMKKGAVGLKEYDIEETAQAIEAVKKKLNVLINIDEFGRPDYVDEKYRDFDDLCRAGD
jgi:RecB family exonuclease